MAIVAHTHPFVIGVDTHARNHAVSILACPHGEILDEAQFPATSAGLARAVSWAGRRRGRPRRAMGDRGHGHLRRPSGPRCRTGRIRSSSRPRG